MQLIMQLTERYLLFQCQVGVLPIGTGNDLAQILGWGASFFDDAQLPNVLEKLEHAQIKMLDR
jgi:diacylglycerol kinase (ATP)